MERRRKIPLASAEKPKTEIPGNEPSILLILKENGKKSEPEKTRFEPNLTWFGPNLDPVDPILCQRSERRVLRHNLLHKPQQFPRIPRPATRPDPPKLPLNLSRRSRLPF